MTQNKEYLPIQTHPIIRYNIRYKGNNLDILRTMQGIEVVLLYIIGKENDRKTAYSPQSMLTPCLFHLIDVIKKEVLNTNVKNACFITPANDIVTHDHNLHKGVINFSERVDLLLPFALFCYRQSRLYVITGMASVTHKIHFQE